MTVTIHAAKPGIVIGKSGVKVEELRRNLEGIDRQTASGSLSRRSVSRSLTLIWWPAAWPISSSGAWRSVGR